MSIRKITAPSTWGLGTVAIPAWFQDAQDTLNALHEFAWIEDFMLPRSITAPGIFGDLDAVTVTNAQISTVGGSLPSGTLGEAQLLANLTANTAIFSLTGASIALGSLGFKASAKVRIPDKTKLSTVAAPGFRLSFPMGGGNQVAFYAGNDQANWRTRVDGEATPGTDSGVAVSTGHQVLEIVRVGTVLTFLIGGVIVRTVSPYATAGSTELFRLQLISTAAVTAGDVLAGIDYIKLFSPR